MLFLFFHEGKRRGRKSEPIADLEVWKFKIRKSENSGVGVRRFGNLIVRALENLEIQEFECSKIWEFESETKFKSRTTRESENLEIL